MKKIIYNLLALLSLCLISCHFVSAHEPESALDVLTFKKMFNKNDMSGFRTAVFSSNGERFLISDDYRFVTLWEKPFLSPLRDLPIENHLSIATLQFFGDMNDTLFATVDGLVQIWNKDLTTKKFEYRFSDNIRRAAITEDGRFIAADSELYDRDKKSLVGRAIAHAVETSLCFGGKSLLLTAGWHDRSIAVRNIYNGVFDQRGVPHPVSKAAISPDERFVAAATENGRCYLWRLLGPEPTPLVIARNAIRSVRFSPDSKWFVIFGTEFIHIFQTDPPLQIARLQPEPALDSLEVASANLIAMGDKSGTVRIYDVSAQQMIGKQKVCETSVQHLKLIPEKELLWAGGCCLGKEREEKGEIALYSVKGLATFIEPKKTDNK